MKIFLHEPMKEKRKWMLKIKHHILYKKDFKKLVKKGES
ncbi:hypothetical protein HPHPA17_0994 [Helicobacter pylori Hp A-17]|nr:hypothetical protein HPHPA17_0994 [Helicobacter pylori Hp A-17]